MQFATLAEREGNWSRNLSRNCFRGTRRSVPCEQRLHLRCVSWRAKSSLCRQPFNSIQKWSGRINKKKRVFAVLDRFRALRKSCVADQSCRNFFIFPRNSPHLMTDMTITFACESRDEFRACTIENWTVVGRGYFSHASSHSENEASALKVAGQLLANFFPVPSNTATSFCETVESVQFPFRF